MTVEARLDGRRLLQAIIEEAALLGDEHTETEAGPHQPHGHTRYFFFTRRAVKLLEDEA
jgi:hypothetical protein